jgi:oligopeptidase B
MKKIILGAVMLAIFACQNQHLHDMKKPPLAKKIPHVIEMHGDQRTDYYYWMNERENPAVIAHLEAENAYTAQALKHTEKLQNQLYEEMTGRLVEDDSSAPYLKNGYYYYSRFEKKKEYPLYCRKVTMDAEEEIILDVNALALGLDYCQVSGLNISPDGKLLAFGLDTLGRRKYTIKIKNLESGEWLEDEIPNTTGGSTWANDNQTLFYTVKDPQTLRSHQIMRHSLGQRPEKDVLVFEEKDETYSVGIGKSRSGKYLMIGSYATVSTEYRILSADQPMGDFQVFEPRRRDHEYSIEHHGEGFFVVTNSGGAKNFKLMQCSEQKTGAAFWQPLLEERKDVLLESVDAFADFYVLSERYNGLSRISVYQKGDFHSIAFPEESHVAGLGVNAEFNSPSIRIRYTSMVAPTTDYDYIIKDRQLVTLKVQQIPGGYAQEEYASQRLMAIATDGTQIPISIVYRKDFQQNGTHPLLLYAYGSYGYSMDPYFSADRLSLLDRGFAYAIAHIRGGQEMGRHWYEEGKLLNKMNTFTDFMDCAQFLIQEKYTSAEGLCAMGGSAGGLLMGAVVNMAPDLWRAVVAAVPFVDVVTTMLDESIPLTTGEFDEWGNPKDKVYYDYMLGYSPYDNVEAKAYPAMLVTTGLHDSQVQYWEPAKWVAKLREFKTDDRLLLLQTDMSAGHGGASGRYKRYEEQSKIYAFLIDQVGKNQ